MTRFQVSLGDTLDREGVDYGTWEADSPSAALLRALRDSDRTRQCEVVHLSDSQDYGRGRPGADRNGAADRSGWFYVQQLDTARVSVWTTTDVDERG